MDRRTFLKTLASLGASVALPANLVAAPAREVDADWDAASRAWDLFEVSEYRALFYANFEEPLTRWDAYGDLTFGVNEIERRGELFECITDLYRDWLYQRAEAAGEEPGSVEIEAQVQAGWADWFEHASSSDRTASDNVIGDWLDAEPDWNNEWDDLYKTGNAQGAAYDHFSREDSDMMDALSIVIVEGQCPGSRYYAAELHIDVDEANRIAAENGWSIRFVYERAT